MKVILSQNVRNLGEMGHVVNVADGYARNFLFPRKLAVPMQSATAKQIEHEMRIIKKREVKHKAHLADIAKQLEAVSVTIQMKAGENDKLFGSVTTHHIADALKAMGQDIDRRSILLEEPIKSLGTYPIQVKLGNGVSGKVNVVVEREIDLEAEAAAKAEAEAIAAEIAAEEKAEAEDAE
ncbi:MAG: 50S ribosomal protein L9 [Candidatus Hydrogenedentota bacterium]